MFTKELVMNKPTKYVGMIMIADAAYLIESLNFNDICGNNLKYSL